MAESSVGAWAVSTLLVEGFGFFAGALALASCEVAALSVTTVGSAGASSLSRGSTSIATDRRGLLFERFAELIPHLLVLIQVGRWSTKGLLVPLQVPHRGFHPWQLPLF